MNPPRKYLNVALGCVPLVPRLADHSASVPANSAVLARSGLVSPSAS